MAKAAAAVKVKPLDNAEQDAVLRARLSHPLAHRPLLGLKNRLIPTLIKGSQDAASEASPDANQLATLALVPDLQAYLLALRRTQLTSTVASSSQLRSYQQQLVDIEREEQACRTRVASLKRDLEGVRRRRREKIEYGRVVEGVEGWFRSSGSGGTEIEESLSTLLSHLTSSFLYNPARSDEDANMANTEAAMSSTHSPHTDTLNTLHAKLEKMLTMAREIREIVGWKPGSGGGASATSTRDSALGQNDAAADEQIASTSAGLSALDPRARIFEPATSRDPATLPLRPASSATTSLSGVAFELEEGEELSSPSASTKRRRVDARAPVSGSSVQGQSSLSGAVGAPDDEEEEGSIGTDTASARDTGANSTFNTRGRGRASQARPASSATRGGGLARRGSARK